MYQTDAHGAPANAQLESDGGRATRQDGFHVRVLVVDDDPGIRETLSSLLEEEGYEISVAGDGEEALHAVLASSEPLVVLLDLFLPKLTGEDVLSTVLEYHGGAVPSHVSFIIITANLQLLTDRLRALIQLHDIPVADKPFDTDRLLALVARAAARARNLVAG